MALNPLTQALQEVRLANTTGYTSYRLSFSAVKGGGETLMQIGEVELLGVADPNSVPTILTAPVNTTANEGGTATFSVTAVGPWNAQLPMVQCDCGRTGHPLAWANCDRRLVLANVTAAMNGNTYRVVVSNPVQEASPARRRPDPARN